jgi:2C-methyl-D-erythritol 2,4-cyclodiphosphate synthase
MLDTAKICYRKGKKGSYIMGSESYTFQILPEKFCHSDYAINLSYSGKDEIKLQELRQIVKEMVAAQALDPSVLTHVMLSESIREVQRIVDDAWKARKEENDVLGKARQQIDQLNKQVADLTAQLNTASQKLTVMSQNDDKFKSRELDIREKEVNLRFNTENKNIDRQATTDSKKIDLDKEVVQLEREQLYLESGNAKEVKNF